MDPLFAVCDSDLPDNMIEITDLDNVYIKVEAQNSIKQELKDFFSFEVPNKQYMPKSRNSMWDGRINLYSGTTGKIYKGLLGHIRAFAKQR